MLNLISKNIHSKIDYSNIDFNGIAMGKPLPLPSFSILDVGMGFGKWGFLIRDTFEVMAGQNFKKADWKIDITGVETFDKCITPIQKQVYNKIIKRDIFDSIDELVKYDLIIMGDVIEHIEKPKAYKLLNELFKHTENILVSTPLGFMPQGAWAGNENERHVSGWELSDFKDYNVVEHRVLKDDLYTDILKNIPNVPKEMSAQINLLVLWLQKKK
jgi:2-polyprenyl-3-methyl-5-hydroxy-6-metoxy-1,4-benzoquinol methylase